MRRTSRAIRRADRTLAPFQKRRHHSALFALHGVGVGGHDRVRHRNVHHDELRGHKKMPHALRDAIAAERIAQRFCAIAILSL